MKIQMITVPVITDAGGDFTQQTPHVQGDFLQMRYVPDGGSPLDTDTDLDVVGTTTGVVLVNHDSIGVTAFDRRYRGATHGVNGAASLYAAGGKPIEDYINVSEELTVTIANGGNALLGTFYFWFG